MRTRSRSPEMLREWDVIPKVDEKKDQSNIQVLICSCNSHISSRDIYILGASIPQAVIIIPSLQRLRSLVSKHLPLPPVHEVNNLHSHFQQADLRPSRALKYVRNPLKLLDLACRSQVHAQQILSVRFVFNVACVILWVMVRRFLEIFGVKIGASAVISDFQDSGV